MQTAHKIAAILFVWLCVFSSCSKAQKTSNIEQTFEDKKILIVYLSRTNNTKAVAEMIQQFVGGDLVPIELRNPYPEDYKTTVAQVEKENQTGFLPPLKTRIENIEKYDIVFVGFPTWGMQLPPPMKTFLSQNDLKDKTIIPFNTNAGYGIGTSFETVKNLCPESKIVDGFSIKGGIERDKKLLVIKGEYREKVEIELKNWLRQLQLLNGNIGR